MVVQDAAPRECQDRRVGCVLQRADRHHSRRRTPNATKDKVLMSPQLIAARVHSLLSAWCEQVSLRRRRVVMTSRCSALVIATWTTQRTCEKNRCDLSGLRSS